MSEPKIARTPQPPYYAVIFTSLRTDVESGYGRMAERMVELAAQQPGFLGVESARGEGGLGITVSYWENEGAIAQWKSNAEHQVAQEGGKKNGITTISCESPGSKGSTESRRRDDKVKAASNFRSMKTATFYNSTCV